jgi:VWFA-related protein
MKKLAVVTVLLSLSLALVAPAAAQSRPRRAPENPPPGADTTQTPSDYYDPNKPVQQRPANAPVLKGGDGRPVTSPPISDTGKAGSQPAAPDGPEEVNPDEIIRVDTALVTLPVSVTDRDGKYIGNLKQKDFRIYEDGVEQEVAYFAPVEKAFTVALLLDMSGSTRDHLGEIQDAALAFVNQLSSSDRVMIVAFDDDVHVLAEPTNDRRMLRNAILSARPGDGTSLYEAVDFVLNQRFNRIDGRKAVVLFTDGVDTTSRTANYQSNVMDAEEDGSLVYVLQYDTWADVNGGMPRPPSNPNGPPPVDPNQRPSRQPTLSDVLGVIFGDNPYGRSRRNGGGGGGGAGRSAADYQRADAYLHDIANKSGARVERAESMQDLDRAFGNIAEELRRQYSLGYYPKTASAAGQRHAIRVRVNRPNLAVKARGTYITGDPRNASSPLAGAPVFRK